MPEELSMGLQTADQSGNSKLGQITETTKVNLCFLEFPLTDFQSTFKIGGAKNRS